MPCGPTTPGVKARSDDLGIDPFSFSQPEAILQGFAVMATMMAAPMRAAMIVAGEAMRGRGTDGD